MEKQDENDRFDFEKKWMKARVNAFTDASHGVEDLIVINLQEKEGMGRISSRIKENRAGINALNRSIYFLYKNNHEMLFYYFKTHGILQDQKEWNYLQQAMTLDFQRLSLTELFRENCIFENLSSLELMILNSDDMAYAGLRDNDRETLMVHRQHIPFLNDPASTPVTRLKAPSMECPLTTEKLYSGLNLVNEKYQLFASQKDLEILFRKIINPNWSNDHEEVHLMNKTNLFRCVVDCVKSTYPHFTYAHIGRSGLFISKKGNVISESAVSSAVLKNEEKKQCIESFFK